jgi:hypothetical protein
VRLDINFRPEQDLFLQFDLLLAVANQE